MEAYMSWQVEDDNQGMQSDSDEEMSPSLTDEITARSAENIRSWKAYLPDDCIDMMIIMGWDQTT